MGASVSISKKQDLLLTLPQEFMELVGQPMRREDIEEIRVRVRRPTEIVLQGGESLLLGVADERMCERILERLSEHSLYACEEELSQGYLTVAGGCRVGIAGSMQPDGAGGYRMASITGFNMRIARECKGAADALMEKIIDPTGRARSTLILSVPGAGKTTLLRDIARQLSNGLSGAAAHRVAIADERGELAGVRMGVPTLDVGDRTDVLDGCPKARAMDMLIRSMSPDVVITDEIGSMDDGEAVMRASVSGVSVIASAHAAGPKDAKRKSWLAPLIAGGCFETIVELIYAGGLRSFKVYGMEGGGA